MSICHPRWIFQQACAAEAVALPSYRPMTMLRAVAPCHTFCCLASQMALLN